MNPFLYDSVSILWHRNWSIQEIMEELDVDYHTVVEIVDSIEREDPFPFCDDSMDGDHASALASVGWGTDEDYGYADEVW